MICALNKTQKEATLKLLGRIVQKNEFTSPEGILKNVYDVIFESFVKKGMQKDAQAFSFAMTQYAADNLYLLLEAETDQIREIVAKIAGTDYQFTLENIQKFKKEDELRKLLGLRDNNLKAVYSNVKTEDVKTHLENIGKTFTPLKEKVMFVRSQPPHANWDFFVTHTKDGKEVKLPRVTEFLNLTRVRNNVPFDNIKTRAGNMVDMVVRKYFQNPMEYDKFKEAMVKDKEFVTAFSHFSENSIVLSKDLNTDIINRYMEEFLHDAMYAINFIQTNYQDAYITDLSTLVEKSNLSREDKDKFYIYSAEIGLRGEIDLIALKPDGTFTIIDIKTTDGLRSQSTENKYKRQASVYDLIMSTVTGLKSSGTNDILYFTVATTNPAKIMGGRGTIGNYKLSISAFEKVTNNNVKPEMLQKEILAYKLELDNAYEKSQTVKYTNEIKPFSPLSPITMAKGRKKPDSLKMKFDENSELSTYEDLRAGKAWIHTVFPELADSQVAIIRMANSNVGGEFFVDAIKLYEKSNKGVAYHEGWHRFSQVYMTKKEKKNLYESIKSDNVTFTTRSGKTLTTENASFLEVEELLAEEFRKYVQDPAGYTFPSGNPKPKSWFRRIWEAIKAIANFFTNNGTKSPEILFKELYTGSFNRSNFSVNNAIFNQLNSFFVDSATGTTTILDNTTFLKFKDFSDFTLGQYLTVNDLTISDLTTGEGIKELHTVLEEALTQKLEQIKAARLQLTDDMSSSTDESVTERMKAADENLKFHEDVLQLILEKNDKEEYTKFGDFIRAYFKTSNFETLRKYTTKNREFVNSIIDEESLPESQNADEEGDSSLLDEDSDNPTADDWEYNKSGNEKEAMANAKSELKDFFSGIPRRLSSDLELQSSPDIFEYDAGGLPVTLSKQEAFYKTLRALQGSLTLTEMVKRLNTPSNYLVFPELLTIKEKLLGSNGNEGLIPKLQRISRLMMTNEATQDEIDEHSKLMSFLSHFTHVMSLRRVDFDNYIVKLNYNQDDENIRTVIPLQTREAMESIIYSIINDFTKGFQVNMERKFRESERKKYTSVYDALYNIFGKGEKGLAEFLANFNTEEFLFDPMYKKFYFNAFYVYKRFETNNPSDSELKDFFSYIGINLNDKIYENTNDRAELMDIYRRMKDVIWAAHRNTGDVISRLYGTTKITQAVNEWKAAKDNADNPQLDGMQKFIANTRLIDAEDNLYKYVNTIFTFNPVEKMLFDGRDFKLMKGNKKNRIFAANRPLFEQLARIEKNYHKRFSSGTMLVADKLQFSYFLPNNMLITEMLINDHISHISDFAKYTELSHLDPIKNPGVLNSFIMSNLFDQNGFKRRGVKLGVSNISQVSVIDTDDSVETKRIQDLKEDEKLLYDFLMVISEGSAEIRRLEASNSAYRLSLQQIEGSSKYFQKAVKLDRNDKFTNPLFLNRVRNYVQHAAWKYQYNLDSETRKLDVNYEKDNKGLNKLGVFDEMLPLSAPKIKEFIKEKGGDMNTLMLRISVSDPELFSKINEEIANYFEDIAIRNEDSYKNLFNQKLSEKGRHVLNSLASIKSNKTFVSMDYTGKLDDHMYRDFIANDFIMAMEDAVLFFGDYTYYKDPIKRRKIIGNNGSINMVDDIMNEAIVAQMDNRSLSILYQNVNNLTDTKDYKLVKKAILEDVKMTSKLVKLDENGEMELVKKIQMLRKQLYGEDVSAEKIMEEKKETIAAFTDIEIGDAAAWINLDTYRRMRMREMTWDLDKDEKEYKRQYLIMRRNLNEPITETEIDFIKKGPYSAFNVAKFAMTGPVFSKTGMPMKPGFDKMGLRVLLPEVDWGRDTRPIMEAMLATGMDYFVLDTGSKAYKPPISKAFSDDALNNVLNKNTISETEHAGGFFKYQQNTTQLNDKSTFSVQLRSIFFEILLVQKQRGKISANLQNAYNKVIKSLSEYISINSSNSLTDMGLDINGKIRDRVTFMKYLKDRLLDIGNTDENLVSLLETNNAGDFSTYLEALPFQKNIMDLISGVIDDNFRKIKLNGTKFYQSPELGTTITKKKISDIPQEYRGSVELKWHDLEIVDGKIVSTTPVECKINFRPQFYPLLNLKHPDGKSIGWYDLDETTGRSIMDKDKSLRRLNEAIQNEEWAKTNKDSIMFIGVRIPLQDINFASHIIIKEFLPEVVGDMIILPPEFYKQTGSDNDIDTVTATFKYLDNRGKPIRRPQENFVDIVNRINELSTEVKGVVNVVNNDNSFEEALHALKQEFIDSEVYASKNHGLEVLDREFTVVENEGYRTISGTMDKKSVLFKMIKNQENSELINKVMQFLESINNIPRAIKSENKKELASMIRKRNNYIKGITNDIVTSMTQFMESPENFEYLTETDSITSIKELAAEVTSLTTGKQINPDELGARQSSLTAMSYNMNLINHNNNFAIRSILGSIIKFRSTLSLLDKLDTVLNKEYTGGSMVNILARRDVQLGQFDEALKKMSGKVYQRNIYTPLLYKKDISKGISLSIFDEDGNRITKNASMVVSSLLDLFKNMDVFPSLNITWLNVKPLIFLMATGVPLRRAILFLNNPIVQEVQREMDSLGSTATARHALVSVGQRLMGDDIFPQSERTEGYVEKGKFRLRVEENGRQVLNKLLGRPGKAADQFLEGRHIQFSENEIEKFIQEFVAYKNDPNRASFNKNLSAFLSANRQYMPIAKDMMAYYGTLLEDGDMFYAYFIKGLGRNSAKLNSFSAIATANGIKNARVAAGVANPEFENRLENESTHSPFFKDSIIQNVLSNVTPELMDKDPYFRQKFIEMIESITSKTFGNPEEKRKVEMRIISDFIEFIYKNFYIHTEDGKIGNTLYEHYMFDITPLLKPMIASAKGYKEFLETYTQAKEAGLSEDTKIESMFNQSLFANQIDVFRAKYPELRSLMIVNDLLSQREHGRDPKKQTNMGIKDIMNMLSQSYLMINLSSNPKEKEAQENIIRDEWKRLLNFDISQFVSIEAELAKRPDRLEFYKNKDNIFEIRSFFRSLAYYSLAQSSHIDKARGSFSYLAPVDIIKNVTETALDNFNKYVENVGSMFNGLGSPDEKARQEGIDKMLIKFQKMFKDMNGDLKWQNDARNLPPAPAPIIDPEEDENWGTEDMIYKAPKVKEGDGLPYMKAHTGKLYSFLADPSIELFKKKLFKDKGVDRDSRNNFVVVINKYDDSDPFTECKID